MARSKYIPGNGCVLTLFCAECTVLAETGIAQKYFFDPYDGTPDHKYILIAFVVGGTVCFLAGKAIFALIKDKLFSGDFSKAVKLDKTLMFLSLLITALLISFFSWKSVFAAGR